ncbi:MAG: transposase [Armatimonadia bacterium]
MTGHRPSLPQRRSVRLQAYDYRSQAVYYITICSADKQRIFGEIVNDQMRLNGVGGCVDEAWLQTADKRPSAELDTHVVMPNHFHALFFLNSGIQTAGDFPGRSQARSSGSIGSIVAGFKQAATISIRRHVGDDQLPVWQRGYYEHIVRNDSSLAQIREYIQNNPINWALDRENCCFVPDQANPRTGWRETT